MSRPDQRSDRRLLVVHLATLAVAGVAILWYARHQWFVTDEWDPIARRAIFGHAPLGLLDPHNEHWSTIAIVIYRVQLAVFGLRTYFPVMFVFVGLHLLAAHLIWRVMRRVGVDAVVATALVAVFAFLGSQSFDLLFAWNLTFSGAVACGFAALLLMPRDRGWSRADATVGVLLVASLAFSGVGVTMTIVVVGYALVVRGWRAAAGVAAAPVVVYGVWLAGWGKSTATGGGIVHGAVAHLPENVWKGVTFAFDLVTYRDVEDARGATVVLGAVIVVGLVAFVVGSYVTHRPPASLVIVCALGAPLFFGITSLRRYGLFNNEWLHFPRYSYVALALLLPLIGVAISAASAWRVPQLVVLGGVVVGLLIHQVGALDRAEAERAAQKQEIRTRIVAAAELVRRGIPRATDRPAEDCCADLDTRALRKLDRDGKLPDVRITQRARDSARTHLEVVVRSGDKGSSGPQPTVSALADVTVTPRAGGCTLAEAGRGQPVLEVLVSARTRVVLSSGEGGKLALWLVPRSDMRTREVPPSTDVYGGPALSAGLAPNLPATLEVAGPGRLLMRLSQGSTTRFCNAKAG